MRAQRSQRCTAAVRRACIAVVTVTLLLACAPAAVAAAKPPKCDPGLQGSFMVTRLWEMTGSMTSAAVVKEFQDNFSSQVRAINGFAEYVGSPVNSTHALFFNVMQTTAAASEAQAQAKTFKADGVLADQIAPAQFTQGGTVGFHYTNLAADACNDDSADRTGMYLATRLWSVSGGADGKLTGQGVVDEFNSGFSSEIQKKSGFLEYGGVYYPDQPNIAFFWNVFTTADGAKAANADAAAFVARTTALNGHIHKFVFTESNITFDYITGSGLSTVLIIVIVVLAVLVLVGAGAVAMLVVRKRRGQGAGVVVKESPLEMASLGTAKGEDSKV